MTRPFATVWVSFDTEDGEAKCLAAGPFATRDQARAQLTTWIAEEGEALREIFDEDTDTVLAESASGDPDHWDLALEGSSTRRHGEVVEMEGH